jgi:hypothetical protein
MKTRLLWIAPAILAVSLLFTSFGGGDNTDYPSGSPGGYTGSPGDGQTCSKSSCHGGSPTTVSGWITSDVPVDGYTPGTTYTISATAPGSGRKGFEISPQSLTGALLGTLTPGSGNKLCNGSKAVTHSSGVTGNPATWTFSWTAPAAGTGPVTFYGAFAITTSATRLTSLVINEAASLPLTATATATITSICSGQSSQLGVSVSGGNPPYTYSWTSNPAGFTSSIADPTVSPVVSTMYTVVVGDGTNSTSSSITINVTPQPSSAAGNDTTICISATQVQLHGTAANYSAVAWITSGDGTFSSTSSLASIYYPGTGDVSTGWVNLYLTASPVSPCSSPVSSGRHIIIDPCTGITGNNGETFNVVLSPNPTTGILSYSLTRITDRVINLTIINNQGKDVLIRTLDGSMVSSGSLDLTSFTKGIYYVKIQTVNAVKVQKVILY